MSLFITNDLHWGKHIEEICDKSYWTLGLLKRNLSSCPMEVKLQAYKGLIWPVLEYASTAWGPHQFNLQEKLEKVQERTARFITSYYNYEPGSMTTILNSFAPADAYVRQLIFCLLPGWRIICDMIRHVGFPEWRK